MIQCQIVVCVMQHTPVLISCLPPWFQLCLLLTKSLRLFSAKSTCLLSPTTTLCIPLTCCCFCLLWITSSRQPSGNPTCFPLLTDSLRVSSRLYRFSSLLSTSADVHPRDGTLGTWPASCLLRLIAMAKPIPPAIRSVNQ